MKESKRKPEWTKDTEKKQPSHYHQDKNRIYESHDNTDCPFRDTKLTVEHHVDLLRNLTRQNKDEYN
jgi:hypothetical protein